MDNTENVVAQMKQFVTVFQAAIAAIEGTYEAKVAVIVDERLKEKDEEIARLTTENESLKVEPISIQTEVVQ